MVNQHTPHEARSQCEKMTPILQRNVGLNQSQKGFVHDGRCLQSMAAALAAHVVASQPPQFVVYQRRQAIQRLRLPRSPLPQQLREIGRDLHRHSPTVTEEFARRMRVSPKHTLSRQYEGIPALLSLLPM